MPQSFLNLYASKTPAGLSLDPALEIRADEDEARWDEKLKKIAKANPSREVGADDKR